MCIRDSQNAGADDQPARTEETAQGGRQSQNDAGYDVDQGQVKGASCVQQRRQSARISGHIAGEGAETGRGHAVIGSVLPGHILGLGIDVHPHGAGGPQAQGGNGEDAAAGAQIHHPAAWNQMSLQGGQAHLGGGCLLYTSRCV